MSLQDMTKLTRQVDSRGRIVLPKWFRERYDIQRGDIVTVIVYHKRI